MIVALSGKKQSGKDTTGQIFNILLTNPHLNNEGVIVYLDKNIISDKGWEIKKFADKLKDMVCMLIGCTREQLENEQYKNTELGEDWECWDNGFGLLYMSREEAIHNATFEWDADDTYVTKRTLTPRLLLQLMGTECGRQILHPNIWVNSLMSEYKAYKPVVTIEPLKKFELGEIPEYPNWIITDMRFPNEVEAVDKRDGIIIRVNRTYDNPCKNIHINEHESETALDDYTKWDYVIENNGTIEDLINKVREIITKEKLI